MCEFEWVQKLTIQHPRCKGWVVLDGNRVEPLAAYRLLELANGAILRLQGCISTEAVVCTAGKGRDSHEYRCCLTRLMEATCT